MVHDGAYGGMRYDHKTLLGYYNTNIYLTLKISMLEGVVAGSVEAFIYFPLLIMASSMPFSLVAVDR